MTQDKWYWILFAYLIAIALWEDWKRENRRGDLKNIWLKKGAGFLGFLFGFPQRILDYIFNKLTTRQFLNPYFFFPFSIILILFLYKKGFFESADKSNGSLILFITLLMVMWYSRETWALRKEQQKSNNILKGRPVLSIIKNVGNTLEVRNDGTNIAYNIKIHFLYNGITECKREIAILGAGKGLSYKIGISDIRMSAGMLSDLINSSPPDKNLKVIIDYSDSIEGEKRFRDKWKLDENVLMSSANEGRFRMIYSVNNEK